MQKILVVEDEERLCKAIVAYLKAQGTQPIAMSAVQETVTALDENEIDLVILDLQLDNGGGLQLLKYIRDTSHLVRLPVIVMSTWEMEPSSYDYLEPGDYLMKPFDMRVLNLMMVQLLGLPREQSSCAYGASLSKVVSPGVDE